MLDMCYPTILTQMSTNQITYCLKIRKYFKIQDTLRVPFRNNNLLEKNIKKRKFTTTRSENTNRFNNEE